jgi:hypothetical protein
MYSIMAVRSEGAWEYEIFFARGVVARRGDTRMAGHARRGGRLPLTTNSYYTGIPALQANGVFSTNTAIVLNNSIVNKEYFLVLYMSFVY